LLKSAAFKNLVTLSLEAEKTFQEGPGLPVAYENEKRMNFKKIN
jgi:hypothetical protein